MNPFKRILSVTCHDCKKPVWLWQSKGPDLQSHNSCHFRRCMKLMREFRAYPDAQEFLRKEMREIGHI